MNMTFNEFSDSDHEVYDGCEGSPLIAKVDGAILDGVVLDCVDIVISDDPQSDEHSLVGFYFFNDDEVVCGYCKSVEADEAKQFAFNMMTFVHLTHKLFVSEGCNYITF